MTTAPSRPYDFRSDTVTLPTAEMMRAISSAPLGDSGRGDDPTVTALERAGAEAAGKEDALYLPSGTMGNLAALLAHECRGGEVVVEEEAHIYNAEAGGLSVLAGGIARPLKGRDGILDPDQIGAAIRGSADRGRAPTRLICLENTHNAAGGVVLPPENLAAIHRLARDAGLPVHLDGARLFNAAAYLGVPVAELCRHADSVMLALSKGLGGPVGALLAGEKAFVARARRAAKMLGGSMRQAGIIAAPGLVALAQPYATLRRDHALALRLARGMAAVDPSLVDVSKVQTNIVNCFVDRYGHDGAAIAGALRARGILVDSRKTKLRFVTHRQVDEVAVDAAIAGMRAALKECAQQ